RSQPGPLERGHRGGMTMGRYVALLRGINVGGKNNVAMADLRETFELAGYDSVRTYIQSGNVIFETSKAQKGLEKHIEGALEARFGLPSSWSCGQTTSSGPRWKMLRLASGRSPTSITPMPSS